MGFQCQTQLGGEANDSFSLEAWILHHDDNKGFDQGLW